MNFKFRITKYLAVSALAVLLLGACSKNNIYMDVAYPNGEENSAGEEGNNDNPDKKDALITFSASVEGRNITRAMSPMGKGLQSWLCAYPSNTTNTIDTQISDITGLKTLGQITIDCVLAELPGFFNGVIKRERHYLINNYAKH